MKSKNNNNNNSNKTSKTLEKPNEVISSLVSPSFMNRYNPMHNGIEVSSRLSKRVVICNTSTIANIPRGNNWTKKDSPSHAFRLPQLEEKLFLKTMRTFAETDSAVTVSSLGRPIIRR